MPARVMTQTEQPPRRARYPGPEGLPRRGEIVAACLVLAAAAHVLFAQLTMIVAVVLWLVTRATRWRLQWLAAPAAVAVVWTLAAGPRAAAAGFADGPARVAAYLGADGHQLSHVLRFTAAFAGLRHWLPRQLPLALLAGSAEAAVAGWLSRRRPAGQPDLPPARPAPLAAVRRAGARRAIRAGGVVTRDGACLGVAAGSGARVTLSWAEVAGGVSVCGSAGHEVLASSFQLVHAAVRRRKPVFALDATADPALPRQLAAACAAAGAPLQVFGDAAADRPGCYEPFRRGHPAQRAALVAAMLSWDAPVSQYPRSCAACLTDVFELLDAAPGDPRVPVLDELLHLLNPAAVRARLQHVPAAYPRRAALAERTAASVDLLAAEPATTAHLARQLGELRASGSGRWLRPPGRGPAPAIDLGRTVAERGVVLFRLGGRQGASSVMLTRLICQDLIATGAALRRIGVGGDGIVWLAGCGSMPRQAVTDLIACGSRSGLPVVAATTSEPAAADLTGLTNVVVAHRMNDSPAARVAAAAGGGGPPGLSPLRDGEFLLAVKNPPRLVPRAQLVQARFPRPGERG
jgi:hypothetical protein